LLEDDLADHEVAGQPGRILHEYDLDSVGLDAVEQSGEAGTFVEVLGAAHAGVTEVVDDLKSAVLCVLRNRGGLTVPASPSTCPSPLQRR
jgi:hypothetical protein